MIEKLFKKTNLTKLSQSKISNEKLSFTLHKRIYNQKTFYTRRCDRIYLWKNFSKPVRTVSIFLSILRYFKKSNSLNKVKAKIAARALSQF